MGLLKCSYKLNVRARQMFSLKSIFFAGILFASRMGLDILFLSKYVNVSYGYLTAGLELRQSSLVPV